MREAGGVAQFAGGVPAMCDGVTQGQAGMELSLFSRDVIALAAAIALSHDMFDGALFLGVCDKIVPGLVMAALSFGHLPAIFVPGGPMPSGLPNSEKAKIRQLYAEGKVGRDALLEAESQSYHGPGTCTFYGTANSNQMLMEIMGLHLPGASFVNPNTPLRDALTRAAGRRVTEITALRQRLPAGRRGDRRTRGGQRRGRPARDRRLDQPHRSIWSPWRAPPASGSTWEDFADLSEVVPLLARIYPNGLADVNHFHAAGGMQFLIGELLDAGLLHADVRTVWGDGLEAIVTSRSWPATSSSGAPVRARAAIRRSSRQPPAVQCQWRAEAAERQSRPCRDQGLGGPPGPPGDRGAGCGLPRPVGASGRVQARRAGARFRGGGAVPGAQGERACPSCTS